MLACRILQWGFKIYDEGKEPRWATYDELTRDEKQLITRGEYIELTAHIMDTLPPPAAPKP